MQEIREDMDPNEKLISTLIQALAVLTMTPHIRSYLKEHDPKALEQAAQAIVYSEREPHRYLVEPFLRNDDGEHLVKLLDGFKGSTAVELMLEALVAKDNQHTLVSALDLIRKGKK
jgi:hypothetical protein